MDECASHWNHGWVGLAEQSQPIFLHCLLSCCNKTALQPHILEWCITLFEFWADVGVRPMYCVALPGEMAATYRDDYSDIFPYLILLLWSSGRALISVGSLCSISDRAYGALSSGKCSCSSQMWHVQGNTKCDYLWSNDILSGQRKPFALLCYKTSCLVVPAPSTRLQRNPSNF